ncbi:MAG TPA: serine/threonine-protein kinase, partial [Kofleriaceae bacterium]
MADDQGTRAPANATTLPADPATAATHAPSAGESLPFDLPAAGYQLGTLIGKGGMGEVIAAQDQRIGREVAFKRMRSTHASGDALNRFLREARIQARLDHPAIVPVYELGKDAEGRPFFTMKRVTGETLAAHLEDPSARQQPLLRAFADVCLAIELAHSKGVVHRDLKPSNIMLGDYGEVYVLDWGVARVLTDRKRFPTGADRGDIDSLGETDGSMLGTPGYMSPEQMRGEDSVGSAADVYSLGAILFEILTGAPLHPRGHASVSSTLTMEEASPAQRQPDRAIAPELDAACAATLAADPTKRPSARELGERVQRYLDGDRDAERRHVLAQEHLAAAREAIASGDTNRRVDALRAAGRALALVPGSTEAADLVSSLIVEPPTVLPEDLKQTLAATETAAARARGRRAATGYISLLSLSVFLLWFDIVNWGTLIANYVAIGFFIAISWTTWKTGRVFLWPVLIGSVVMS